MTNRLRRILQLLTVTLLLSAIIPGYAMAQGSEPTDDEVNAIAKQLYCPVCENISLDACGTAACEQWRNIIRETLFEKNSKKAGQKTRLRLILWTSMVTG